MSAHIISDRSKQIHTDYEVFPQNSVVPLSLSLVSGVAGQRREASVTPKLSSVTLSQTEVGGRRGERETRRMSKEPGLALPPLEKP